MRIMLRRSTRRRDRDDSAASDWGLHNRSHNALAVRTRMPGPGAKTKKQKSKKNAQPNPHAQLTPPTFVADIDNAEDWAGIVSVLCETLQLPGTFLKYPPC